ncbi:MAG: hypothetical protein HGA85_00150 [Nanoarchaeota archaeon]|nr:hypothetical protein [Nanoarchaeota archaeon]
MNAFDVLLAYSPIGLTSEEPKLQQLREYLETANQIIGSSLSVSESVSKQDPNAIRYTAKLEKGDLGIEFVLERPHNPVNPDQSRQNGDLLTDHISILSCGKMIMGKVVFYTASGKPTGAILAYENDAKTGFNEIDALLSYNPVMTATTERIDEFRSYLHDTASRLGCKLDLSPTLAAGTTEFDQSTSFTATLEREGLQIKYSLTRKYGEMRKNLRDFSGRMDNIAIYREGRRDMFRTVVYNELDNIKDDTTWYYPREEMRLARGFSFFDNRTGILNFN